MARKMSMIRDPFISDRRTRVVVFTIVALLLAVELIDVRYRVSHLHADWLVYWSAARHFNEPGDPYAIEAPTHDYYIYPPLFALVLRPLSPMRAEDAISIWYVLNVLLLFGCYSEWRRIYLAIRDEPPPRWLVMSTVVSALLPVVSTLQGGQVSIVILYLALVGCRLMLFTESVALWIAAGVLFALPAAIKLSPALVGAVVVVQLLAAPADGSIKDPHKRGCVLAASLAGGTVLWFLVVPALIAGWHRNLELLTMFVDHIVFARARMNDASPANHGIVRMVATFAEVAAKRFDVVIPLAWVGSAAMALSLAFGIPVALTIRKLIRSGTPLDHVVVVALAAAASLFYSPVSWHVHFTLAIPFVFSAPLWLIDKGRERAGHWLSGAIVATFLLQNILRVVKWGTLPLLGPLFAICVVAFALIVLRRVPELPPMPVRVNPSYS